MELAQLTHFQYIVDSILRFNGEDLGNLSPPQLRANRQMYFFRALSFCGYPTKHGYHACRQYGGGVLVVYLPHLYNQSIKNMC